MLSKVVDYDRRTLIAPNHTCSHMLNFALREVLGTHVDQKGSIVLPEKLRYDFSHEKPMKPEELRKIESIVNEQIKAELDVFAKETKLADAKRINCLRAVFGQVLSLSEKLTFAMMFWVIWKRRNEKLWEGVVRPVMLAVEGAKELLQQWQLARSSKANSQQHRTATNSTCRQAERWQKPNCGELKCNLDAAIFREENKFGGGICVRDENGAFRGAKTMWFYGSPSPREAEATVLLQALHFI
ncbi:hypothetical protein OROHE_019540 [Orobanche hederae]